MKFEMNAGEEMAEEFRAGRLVAGKKAWPSQ